ncbi:MAG: glycosyltransferase family 39 protein [bacterium]|jgi:4-amino-4-deoxy-L-arabinose transferase-like glycosyltransferase|nr:glycosyltransferase family 39 protein [candidate division KSB1 bacterium]MDH7559925.1 glycosyltransferase family 39 protein [bacterium]
MKERVARNLQERNWLLLAILVLALAVRLAGIQFGKPFRYHPDEIKLVVQAGRLLEPGGRSTEGLFGLGSYPPLYTYLLALVYGGYGAAGVALGVFKTAAAVKEFYYTETFTFHLIGRVVTALLGTANVLLLYHVGARASNRRVGLLAAMFCATVFLHVRNSHHATVDVPATFMATAALLCAVLVVRRGRWPEVVAGGLLTGLAAATKFNVGVVAVPFVLALLLRAGKEKRGLAGAVGDAALYVGVACIGAGFVMGCPLVVADPQRFLQGLFTYGDLQAQGKVGVGGGFFAYFTGGMSPGYGVFSHNSVPAAIGPVLTVLCVIGIVRLVLRPSRMNLLLIAFIVPYYLVIGSVNYKTMRQFLPLVPFLMLAAAALVDALMAHVRIQSRWRAVAWAVLVAGAVAPELYKDVRWALIMRGPDPRTLAKAWIEEHVPAGTVLAVEKYGPPLLDQDDPKATLRLRSGHYHCTYQIVDSQTRLSFGYRGEPDTLLPVQDYLAGKGAEYFVGDSFTRGSFYLALSEKSFPRLVAHRRAFYSWLEREAEEVARFAPTHNWANLFPTIVVYRLPGRGVGGLQLGQAAQGRAEATHRGVGWR